MLDQLIRTQTNSKVKVDMKWFGTSLWLMGIDLSTGWRNIPVTAEASQTACPPHTPLSWVRPWEAYATSYYTPRVAGLQAVAI